MIFPRQRRLKNCQKTETTFWLQNVKRGCIRFLFSSLFLHVLRFLDYSTKKDNDLGSLWATGPLREHFGPLRYEILNF